MRPSFLLGLAASVCALALTEHSARACGGCFTTTESDSVVTDHRMILSISPQQTTLYDQIRYAGSPASFAWVLPISGVARVGLSSDLIFATLDQQTQTQVIAPPRKNCPSEPYCGDSEGSVDGAAKSSSSDASAGEPPVTVTKSEVVGPYETVQLHSTDPNALNAWLAAHNFVVPAAVQPIISQYVADHFDFLAMKLVPGAQVQSMRPVRVTTAGAAPVLPLRMVAAGTGPTVGLTLWVVAEGRYEPQNFPFFQIDASELVWDFATRSSNFKSLRAAKEAALNGRGWEVESSSDLYTVSFSNRIRAEATNGDYLAVEGGDGAPDAGMAESADHVRDADLATLFADLHGTTARVTRLRADLAHASLVDDLVLQASPVQDPLDRTRRATLPVDETVCPTYPPCDPNRGGLSAGGGGDGCNSSGHKTDDDLFMGTLLASFAITLFSRAKRKDRKAA